MFIPPVSPQLPVYQPKAPDMVPDVTAVGRTSPVQAETLGRSVQQDAQRASERRPLRPRKPNDWDAVDVSERGELLLLLDDVAEELLAVRSRLMPMLSLPALPHGFFWTDADDNDVPVDLPDLAALSAAHEAAIVAQGFAIHMRQRSMKAEIEALESADALAGYTPGWPIPPAN